MRNTEETSGAGAPARHDAADEVAGDTAHDVAHDVAGLDPEAGLATAEYAVATVAAVGFAGLLIVVLKSDTVRGLLESIISSALSV